MARSRKTLAQKKKLAARREAAKQQADAAVKPKSKHRKLKIAMAVVTAVLAVAIASGVIWYVNSPLPTVVNMMKAAKNKDVDGILDCIEPEKAEMMRVLLSFVDADADGFLERMMPEGMGSMLGDGGSRLKFSGYHREGDRAWFSFGDDTYNVRKIEFVRIDGKWYLTFNFAMPTRDREDEVTASPTAQPEVTAMPTPYVSCYPADDDEEFDPTPEPDDEPADEPTVEPTQLTTAEPTAAPTPTPALSIPDGWADRIDGEKMDEARSEVEQRMADAAAKQGMTVEEYEEYLAQMAAGIDWSGIGSSLRENYSEEDKRQFMDRMKDWAAAWQSGND